MIHKILQLTIGDIEAKRQYRKTMGRVKVLPGEYRQTFRQIQKYINTNGAKIGDDSIFQNMEIYEALIGLLEDGASGNQPVKDLVGQEIGDFTEDFLRVYIQKSNTREARLNQEILERLQGKENGYGEHH